MKGRSGERAASVGGGSAPQAPGGGAEYWSVLFLCVRYQFRIPALRGMCFLRPPLFVNIYLTFCLSSDLLLRL